MTSELPAELPESIAESLNRFEQQHVLRWWSELDEAEREGLIKQLRAINFARLNELVRQHLESLDDSSADSPEARARRAGPPAEVVRLPHSSDDQSAWQQAREEGERLLSEGSVGAILVAGGQGTRLGYDSPKGVFPIGPVNGSSLFQILCEQLLARSRRAGVTIPFYVMTSDATHDETGAFLREHDFFGLDPDAVKLFRQGSMPAVDEEGRLLLAEKGRLATSPDGHGGLLQALHQADLLEDMQGRGVRYLHYFQVDNPTSIVCDPTFIGFHALRKADVSVKVVAKRDASEKLGVVVQCDDRTQIIEYSDMPDDVAARSTDAGELELWAGSTAIHVFSREFLERVAADDRGLPFHVAHKAVPHLDDTGQRIEPDAPNAYKFERFIFDTLPLANRVLVVETDRAREFNPVKNREGQDSPDTCRAALQTLHRGWLEQAGVPISADRPVEISPLFALDAEELRSRPLPDLESEGPIYLGPENASA